MPDEWSVVSARDRVEIRAAREAWEREWLHVVLREFDARFWSEDALVLPSSTDPARDKEEAES